MSWTPRLPAAKELAFKYPMSMVRIGDAPMTLAVLLLFLPLLVGQVGTSSIRLVQLAARGDLVGVKALIARGSDPNTVDNARVRGWTALMAASKSGHLAVAQALVEAHAKINAKNEYGATALDVAEANGHVDVAALIRSAGGTGRPKTPPSLPAEVHDSAWAKRRCEQAALEARIQARFPNLICYSDVSEILEPYRTSNGSSTDRPTILGTMRGERVTLELRQPDIVVASASWSTDFPSSAAFKIGDPKLYVPAAISLDDLLIPFLQKAEFTQEDLDDLARSSVPEVRVAAISNSRNQMLIQKASGDAEPQVRKAAAARLADQSVLWQIATRDDDPEVRGRAIARLDGPDVLVRIACEGTTPREKIAALERLTDQFLLARVASGCPDKLARHLAIGKLTDQAALTRIATGHPDASTREDAAWELDDQSVLSKLSKDDMNENVRRAASLRLEVIRGRLTPGRAPQSP
jgi:hypothetical protein